MKEEEKNIAERVKLNPCRRENEETGFKILISKKLLSRLQILLA